MAAMTRFDKIVLGLTAAFLVVTGGYFVSGQLGEAEYQVTVSKQVPAVSASLPDPAAGDRGEAGPGHRGLPGEQRPLPKRGRAH